MENIQIIFGLAKIALEVFRDERGTSYQRLKNDLLEIEKEWQDEMALSADSRSDLSIDRLLFRARQISEKIIDEAGG